jgi:hypothetical protein
VELFVSVPLIVVALVLVYFRVADREKARRRRKGQ